MATKNQRKLKLLQDRMQAGLTEDERDFLQAAELGDIDAIKTLIQTEAVSVNCVDPQGRTALEAAVAANDEDIVHYLLAKVKDKTVHKALLCACDNDRDKISEIILQHPLYQERNASATHEQIWKLGSKSTSGHPNVDTLLREALLRAAKRNNFLIVKQLMLMGAHLDPPHDYFCNCNECTTQRSEDFKVYTNHRLDTYSAMASPAYISLTEEDPIMSAFKLSQAFKRMAEIESEFKVIYNELAAQVETFTLALLDQCQSSDEVKAVLSGKPDLPEEDADDEEDNDILPMLSTAIRMEQKRFVAHPQCQAQIAELWYSGVPFLRYLNRFTYLMLAIPVGIVLVPILSIIYLIAPWSKVTVILDTPLMRFLSYTCSYLSFLVFVMVTKLKLTEAFDSFACDEQHPYVFAIITILLMWIFGLIWEECKQIWSAGAKDYFRSLWNVVDSLMLSMLLASFVLEIVTPIRLRQVINGDRENGSSATPLCTLIADGDMSLVEFCTIGRKDNVSVIWEPEWIPDPELLSDILFTFGTILSIGRFSFIMPANEALGTMLVSFHRTINDLLKLCGMFILVLIAFASGLSALYAPSKCRNRSFGSFEATISTLTWSMFGMGDSSAPATDGQGPLASLTNNPHRDAGVTTIGYYLYAIYVFAAMIVLLNLLIAVMSNTFEEVQGVSDVEWKFARTELWLTFIEPGSPVPPPFNVIPSPKSIVNCFRYCFSSCSCEKKPEPEPKIFKYAAVQTSDLELSNIDKTDTKSECSVTSMEKHNRQDLYCVLIRRYTREVERQRSEGDDAPHDASEDMLRKLIERVTSKIEKKIEELYSRIMNVESNVNNVQEGESDIVKLQQEHTGLIKDEGKRRDVEGERFLHMLDQAKLELLSRMEAERIEVIRIWEEQLREVLRRLDDSRRRVADRVADLEALHAADEAARRAAGLPRPRRTGPDE
ncbi:short transient receptor potential channel 3-like isoform X3 [Haliotis rufescens]|uniref:short transient receptor potential channel 3-like isoform X3 n=1 Tax=Haliotis rufescens TaxID=6454 RepID=UPI001EAFF467|nr:short transient receptor potential channel 3-like isoform X3 [Haliotis rufescens]